MLTSAPRLALAVCLVAAGIVTAMLTLPTRYAIDGVSMAPGLLPGDVVTTGFFPWSAASRAPQRFERWIIAAPDGTAIKRVIGLPGEGVSIRDGDLSIDGHRVVSPPPMVAETASIVPGFTLPTGSAGVRPCRHTVAPGLVLDDAGFAPTERRLLLPVHDVGLAAVIRMHTRHPPSLRARVGGFVIGWRPPFAGRFAVVAGRLDGQLVAACWHCADGGGAAAHRSCLPTGAPAAWQVERPWPQAAAEGDDDEAPRLGLWIGAEPPAAGHDPDVPCTASAGEIEQFVVWRDVLHRPAADGRDDWQLGDDQYFLLGDFPSGSRDSRHWGPLRRGALSAAVSAAR